MLNNKEQQLVQQVIRDLHSAQEQCIQQVKGAYVELNDDGQPCGFCADGWVYHQSGVDVETLHGRTLPDDALPLDKIEFYTGADKLQMRWNLHYYIAYLNDEKDLTFGEIAGRLEVVFGVQGE